MYIWVIFPGQEKPGWTFGKHSYYNENHDSQETYFYKTSEIRINTLKKTKTFVKNHVCSWNIVIIRAMYPLDYPASATDDIGIDLSHKYHDRNYKMHASVPFLIF